LQCPQAPVPGRGEVGEAAWQQIRQTHKTPSILTGHPPAGAIFQGYAIEFRLSLRLFLQLFSQHFLKPFLKPFLKNNGRWCFVAVFAGLQRPGVVDADDTLRTDCRRRVEQQRHYGPGRLRATALARAKQTGHFQQANQFIQGGL